MARNVEIKARAFDLAVIQQRVEALGAVAAGELTQTDTFFDVPGGRLKLREFSDDTAELISYVRDDQSGPKVSSYLVTSVTAPDRLRDVLGHALGLRGVVRKRRTLFLLGQTRIHLDEVEGLGAFVEFEVVLLDGQPEVEGQRLALDLLEKIAISPADLVARAYVDLLQDAVY
jgi:predicted adenylyl cyclase CyaB